MEKYGIITGSLLYENGLSCEKDLEDFILEGSADLSFPEGHLRLANAMDAANGQKANYVLWCPQEFPSDILIEWKFRPIREPGLCMMFFAAAGRGGEDLFSEKLAARTGEYVQYHHGDIDAFHVSYFRRKEPDERAFHTCNLRKSYGFHLVAQGADPIPDAGDADGMYDIAVLKQASEVVFFINGLEIFHFHDDGKTCGGLLKGGRIGFRQLAPLIGEYADLRVSAVCGDAG